MQKGSLVETTFDYTQYVNKIEDGWVVNISNPPVPGQIYTVEEVCLPWHIKLVESKVYLNLVETSFHMGNFKEVQKPDDVNMATIMDFQNN